MPRISLFLIPAFIIIFSACQPTRVSSHSYTGKLVLAGPCNNYVVQFIGSEPVGDKAEANWINKTSDSLNVTYTNVFAVYDRCMFAQTGLKQGDVFTFEIMDKNTAASECFVCQIYFATPAISNNIVNCQKIK